MMGNVLSFGAALAGSSNKSASDLDLFVWPERDERTYDKEDLELFESVEQEVDALDGSVNYFLLFSPATMSYFSFILMGRIYS
jgi:hypothetical protein